MVDRQIPAKSLGYLSINIYVPVQLPKTFFLFLKTKTLWWKRRALGYQFDFFLETSSLNLCTQDSFHLGPTTVAITTGAAHHDDVNVHVVKDAPGVAESRLGGAEGVAGTDEELGERTPRRTLGGIKCWILLVVGVGPGAKKKLWSYKLRGIDWLFFISLKWGGIFWQQNLFGVRGWFELSVWSSWFWCF